MAYGCVSFVLIHMSVACSNFGPPLCPHRCVHTANAAPCRGHFCLAPVKHKAPTAATCNWSGGLLHRFVMACNKKLAFRPASRPRSQPREFSATSVFFQAPLSRPIHLDNCHAGPSFFYWALIKVFIISGSMLFFKNSLRFLAH